MEVSFSSLLKDIRWHGYRSGSGSWEISLSNPADIQSLMQAHQTGLFTMHSADGNNALSLTLENDTPNFVMPPEERGGCFRVCYNKQNWLQYSRHIPLQGSPNCRDLGGYSTAFGTTVKWRKLLRSGHWHELSDDDQQIIDQLNLKLICDFRSQEEQERQPPRLSHNQAIHHLSLSITPGSAISFFESVQQADKTQNNHLDIHQHMCAMNNELALKHMAQYKSMFKHILQQTEGAILINCTAGKDRTGFGAALILLALGVDKKTVIEDYMKTHIYTKDYVGKLSNKWFDEISQQSAHNKELIKGMLSVHIDFINSALNSLEQKFGSIENYLEELELDQAALQELRSRYTI